MNLLIILTRIHLIGVDFYHNCLDRSISNSRLWLVFIMPPPFSVGGGAYSIALACMYVHQSVRYVHMKNGFYSISFEKISVLDSYFIHRYKIIKYWPSLIQGKIRQSLWELKALFQLHFLQSACCRVAPGQGHLCHIDTFLVIAMFYRNSCIWCKHYWPWSDASFCIIWSGSALFASYPLKGLQTKYRIRPNFRTVRLGFSKLLGTHSCGKI